LVGSGAFSFAIACWHPAASKSRLALALALVAYFGKEGQAHPRCPVESFREGIRNEREHDRWSAVNAAANAICLALGARRDPAIVSLFKGEQRQP
jgi:hypothetical protein